MKIDTSNEDIGMEAARLADRLRDGDFEPAERAAMQDRLVASESFRNELDAVNMVPNLVLDMPKEMHAELMSLVEAPKPRRWVWLSGLAASAALVAVLLAGWFVYQQQSASTPHITTAATTRDVTLPDGSVAHLNVRTDLQWLDDATERRVALLDGEALFEVKHDAGKPFAVMVNQSEIRVLGTQFNVRRRESSDVVVTVLEGTVRVSSQPTSNGSAPTWTRTLHANDQLVYNAAGLVRDVHAAARANAAKWREGILEFEDEALSNIVEDLGRYTDRRILVPDQRLAQLRLGGQLDVRKDVRSSLTLLEKLAPLAVRESGNDFVLDYRQEPTQERR